MLKNVEDGTQHKAALNTHPVPVVNAAWKQRQNQYISMAKLRLIYFAIKADLKVLKLLGTSKVRKFFFFRLGSRGE